MHGSHGVATLLISAAAGYWVLTLAAKEKNRLKKLGQLVGLVIIVVSLAGAACKIYCQIGCGSKSYCPPGAMSSPEGKACPFTGKDMAAGGK